MRVEPEEIHSVCAHFSGALDGNGSLDLYFDECYFAAAPFLMFRLKREGFSRCRAFREGRGIILTALR